MDYQKSPLNKILNDGGIHPLPNVVSGRDEA